MLTVEEAIQKIKSLSKSFGEEIVALQDAYGRVLAEKVYSDRDYPPFNRATMDGVAIRLSDFEQGKREFEIVGEIYAGSRFESLCLEGQCVKIMTGAAVPKEFDLIVRIEDVIIQGNKAQLTNDSSHSYQNIAKQGEDLKSGELIIREGTILTPSEISSLAVVGKTRITVKKLPTVAIISTGNEIKPADEIVLSHQIRDSNSFAVLGFLKQYGIPVGFKKLVQDDKETLSNALHEALKYDIVITSGGISMGDADFLPEIFKLAGVAQDFHKVQVKPGKPLWVGHTSSSTVFGLPGNPVSVQVGLKVFLEPFLRKSLALEDAPVLRLPILERKKKKTKFDEFFPCKITNEEIAGIKPIAFNGSGDITATLQSDGIALHPSDSGDLEAGDIINFFPWRFF